MRGIVDCIKFLTADKGNLLHTNLGCDIVTWYEDGKFYQSTSFDYNDSFEMEDLEDFNKWEWTEKTITEKITLRFEVNLGCQCSTTGENFEFDFDWNESDENKKIKITGKLNEWVLSKVDATYYNVKY